MKKYRLFLFVFFSLEAIAQKNIDGLVQAEKRFAAHAVSVNTKDAFLAFLDSNGVVFENGAAVNGIQTWSKKEKRPGILNWHPQFAEIAGSNDFGYTTGPWTFQPKSISDSVVARGQYITVWHLDKKGEWKFLVDLGTGNLPSTDSSDVQKIDVPKISRQPINLLSLVKAEEKFIKAFGKNRSRAYRQFLSVHSILNRNGSLPATTATTQETLIQQTPSNLRFSIAHSGIARSGDLGFVYGSVVLSGKKENYLRIWRSEKDGWKIALEVLKY